MGDIPVYKHIGTSTTPDVPLVTEVLIVGGGPVGLTLALDLAQKGRKVTLVSRLDFIAGGSKAICFAKRSLDIWDRLGVAQPMIDKGVVWNVGKVFAGDSEEPLYQFDMLPLKDQKSPGFINIQQYYVEEILIDAVLRNGSIDTRWGHEVVGVEQDEDGVRALVRSPGGTYEVEADWLIACDGSKSPIRNMLGLDFEGRIFEDNFLIADVKFTDERPSERWFWFNPPFNPGGSALLHKQPDDVWRLDFQLGWNIDREASIRPENVEPFVRGMIGEGVKFAEEWYSVYTFQCRRMRRFVHDRIIFAGDSAHLVSPFGARGCNGGIADVDNLAWKLDLVLRGNATYDLLETYNDEAIVTADENILNSTRSTDFMTPKSRMSTAFRDAVLELAQDHDFARPFVNSGRLSTAVSYPASALNTPDRDEWSGGVEPGSPAVDARLGEGWLLEQVGGDFVLVSAGQCPEMEGVRQINLNDTADHDLVRSRYALKPGAAYLFRPDQYVAARWYAPTGQDVMRAIDQACGRRVSVDA